MAFVSPVSSVFNRAATNTPQALSTRRNKLSVPKMTLKADLDHIALDCRNTVNMHAFYRDVLRFEHMQMPKAPFPSVRVSDVTILDFMQSDKPQGLDGANHICFSVSKDGMDELKIRLEAAGYEIPEPKLRGGAKGRGWSVYIRDPEENMLEFRYYD